MTLYSIPIRIQRLSALAMLALCLFTLYGGTLMAANQGVAAGVGGAGLAVNDVENKLKLIEQQLEQIKDTSAADLAVTNIRDKLEQIEQNKLEQIEQRLEQVGLNLDEKGVGIVDINKAIKKLQQDSAMLSSNVRSNKTELNAQKSLIEDNSVRLYEILIRISNAVEDMQALQREVKQSNQPGLEVQGTLENLGKQLERFWTLLLLGLVFLPTLAFTLVNRGKQRQGVLLAFTGLSLGYLTLGFGLMYGVTHMGLVGNPVHWFGDLSSALPGTDKPWIEFMLYQTALVVFAGLVIHTTIKQHLSNTGQLLLALFVATLLIPILGHWLWAQQLITDNSGLLQGLGLVDESKVTTLGLLAACFVGVMLWRLPLSEAGQQTADSQPVYSVGTALLFYLAWLGFTADISATEYSVADGALAITLAASAGGLCVFLQQLLFYPNEDNNLMAYVPGGFISGLVAIAACVQSVTFMEAMVIGAIAGLLYRSTFDPLSRLWQQQTGSSTSAELVVIHLVGGIWGLACVGLFGTNGNFTFPDVSQLINQLQVIGIVLIYGSVMAILAVLLFTWHKKKTAPPAESGH
jgi:Amt family ammonium transporter